MRNYPEENPYPALGGLENQPPVPRDQTSDDPDAIRAEIIHTRGEMSQTLNAIQERLDPERLKAEVRNEIDHVTEHVKEEVRDATIGRAEHFMNQIEDTAREAGDSVFDRVRAHPIPAALVGVGLAWLFLSGSGTSHHARSGRYDEERYGYGRRTPYRSRGSYGYAYGRYPYSQYAEERFVGQGYGRSNQPGVADQVRGTVSNVADQVQNQASQLGDQVQGQVQQVGQQVQQLGSQAQDTMSDMGDQIQDRVSDFSGDVQDEFAQLRWTAERTMRENPLAMGAVALALGAAVGMIVPETHQEDELFGGARDQVMERAESAAQGALQDVQQKVQQVADQAQSAVGSMQSSASGQAAASQGGQSGGQRPAGQGNQPSQTTGQSGQHTSGQTTSHPGNQPSGQSAGTQTSPKPGTSGQQGPGQSGRQSAA